MAGQPAHEGQLRIAWLASRMIKGGPDSKRPKYRCLVGTPTPHSPASRLLLPHRRTRADLRRNFPARTPQEGIMSHRDKLTERERHQLRRSTKSKDTRQWWTKTPHLHSVETEPQHHYSLLTPHTQNAKHTCAFTVTHHTPPS